ncbi:hypothetical protein D3C81_1624090 [compost metagenome]
MITPAMISAKMNTSMATPSPASLPSSSRLMSRNWGRNFCTRLVMSVAACIHTSCRRWPISGQLATKSGGCGMRMLPPRTAFMASSADWSSAIPSR